MFGFWGLWGMNSPYLARAISLARANTISDGLPRMAAVIMDGKREVSWGWNSRRSHPLQFRFSQRHDKICVHAEVSALAAAREPVDGMAMYVARVLKDGSPALAKPCSACQSALAAFGIENVSWTE